MIKSSSLWDKRKSEQIIKNVRLIKDRRYKTNSIKAGTNRSRGTKIMMNVPCKEFQLIWAQKLKPEPNSVGIKGAFKGH